MCLLKVFKVIYVVFSFTLHGSQFTVSLKKTAGYFAKHHGGFCFVQNEAVSC